MEVIGLFTIICDIISIFSFDRPWFDDNEEEIAQFQNVTFQFISLSLRVERAENLEAPEDEFCGEVVENEDGVCCLAEETAEEGRPGGQQGPVPQEAAVTAHHTQVTQALRQGK